MRDPCVRHRRDLVTVGLTAPAYLVLARYSVHAPRPAERDVFAAVNHGEEDRRVLRIPQQLGTPWILPAISGLGWVTHRRRLALAAAVALPVEKGCEVLVKKLFPRPRPAQSDHRARLHDDAPADGPSYPSGHVAIAVCALGLAGPYVSIPSLAPMSLAACLAGYARVRQGAHYPRDAVGGALLGLALSAGLGFAFGRPGR
jgi:membrane-associated phospholipid phosphatase